MIIMNKKLLTCAVCVAFGVGVPFGVVRAQQQQTEENAVKATVFKMWSALTIMDSKKFKSSVAFPMLTLETAPQNSVGSSFVYKNVTEFDEEDARIRQQMKKEGVKSSSAGFNGTISDLSVTMVNPNVASVIYKNVLNVNGKKQPPVTLISVLRKKDNAWKIVFTTIPQ